MKRKTTYFDLRNVDPEMCETWADGPRAQVEDLFLNYAGKMIKVTITTLE